MRSIVRTSGPAQLPEAGESEGTDPKAGIQASEITGLPAHRVLPNAAGKFPRRLRDLREILRLAARTRKDLVP